MTIKFNIIFICILLCITSCKKSTLENKTDNNGESVYIYMIMKSDDTPKFDYEGNEILRHHGFWEINENPKQYEFDLLALRIPKGEHYFIDGINDIPENYMIEFKGVLTRIGEDGIKISGNLKSKINGKVQFVKMISDKFGRDNEFPEIPFTAGDHDIEFEGTVTGWIDE